MNQLDRIDQQILNLLSQNARISYQAIAQQVGLSRTAITKRIQAMEESGIIKGYKVITSPQPSTGIAFIVNIQLSPNTFFQARDMLQAEPCILTLMQTLGDCFLTAICEVEARQNVRDFLNRIYNTVPGVLSISSHMIIDVIKGSLTQN